MRFLGLHFLRRWHHQHHPFCPHPGHGFGRAGVEHLSARPGDRGGRVDRGELLMHGLAGRLDLSGEQQALLSALLTQVQHQRSGLKASLFGSELQALIASENFDRTAAQQMFDARLDTLRAAGPALVEALGDFFDSLDFEQQQALRFQMRVRRARAC